MMRRLLIAAMALGAVTALAQDGQTPGEKKVTVTGSVHSEVLIPQEDEKIGAAKNEQMG